MRYTTIGVARWQGGFTITLDRPERQNALNVTMLEEINRVLDEAEQDPSCRLVVLEGKDGVFCTGKDFEEASQDNGDQSALLEDGGPLSDPYMDTLKRFTLSPKIIVAAVDGKSLAGGTGFVAASDLAVATQRSQFGLSEALWGLIPAIVAPFLIRRTGFQAAYRMALTTMPVNATEAKTIGLIDEVAPDLEQYVHRLWLRLGKLDESTVSTLKRFFCDMWIIDGRMEQRAISQTFERFLDPNIKQNLSNYVRFGKMPWESR